MTCTNTSHDHGGHGLRLFGFGPGFCATLTLRPRATSVSVQRQSVRPPSIGIAIEGRINPRASQRLSVLNETPIFTAALFVLYVFVMVASYATAATCASTLAQLFS